MIRNKKFIISIAVTLAMLVLLGVYHDRRTCWGSNDFDTYFFAGKLVVSGDNLYTHEAFKTTLSPFLYLPFFAILTAPLTFLHIRIAAAIWYLLSILSLAGCVYFALKLITNGDNIKELFFAKPYFAKAAAFIFVIIAWVDNVSLAQIDFMILLLILGSLYLHEKHRPYAAGILLAAASVIKIYPAYFLLYFIAKRQFKAAAGFFIGIILFVGIIPFAVLGMDGYNDSMQSWFRIRALPHLQPAGDDVRENYARCESQFKPSNQAFSAVVMRYFMKDNEDVTEWKTVDFKYTIYWPHPLTPGQTDTLIKLLLLTIILISYANLDYRRIYRDKIYQGLEYSVMFLSMLLFFPMVKSHTFAPVLFPLIMFSYLETRAGDERPQGQKWKEILFWMAVGAYVLQAFRYMQVLGAGNFSILFLWMLFVGMMIDERRRRRCAALR